MKILEELKKKMNDTYAAAVAADTAWVDAEEADAATADAAWTAYTAAADARDAWAAAADDYFEALEESKK